MPTPLTNFYSESMPRSVVNGDSEPVPAYISPEIRSQSQLVHRNNSQKVLNSHSHKTVKSLSQEKEGTISSHRDLENRGPNLEHRDILIQVQMESASDYQLKTADPLRSKTSYSQYPSDSLKDKHGNVNISQLVGHIKHENLKMVVRKNHNVFDRLSKPKRMIG
jgi:hypothetical protein